jgi:ribose transport system substrate-binding protein
MKGIAMSCRSVLCLSFIIVSVSLILTNACNAQEKEKKVTIGLVGKSQSNPVFIAAYAGARVAAKELGDKMNVEIIIDWQTPQNESPREQAEAIDRLVGSGVSGISVACSDPNILTPPIDKAAEHGIPVICFDADAPKSKRFAYYGTDDNEFGRMMMKELAYEMKDTGVIAVIAGNKNASNLQRRVKALTDELKNHPSIKLLPNGVFYHNEIPEKAAEVVAHAQKANPQIGGWAFIGGWPLFMKNGIKWEPGEVKIVACDALPMELEYVQSGHVQVLIAQGCFMWGYKSVEILLNKILMNKVPPQNIIADPLTTVKKENCDEWSLKWKKWLIKEAVYR